MGQHITRLLQLCHQVSLFFGDAGKFVSCGQQRIPSVCDEAGRLDVTVTFAVGEKEVCLFGFAKTEPKVMATTGSVGKLEFDPKTGRFSVNVHPSITVS